ncbi:Bacterial protein of uncharacterised function (DUF853) [Raoultella terrigena]|uniref:Bacterial protein of uncharacterized function (DUF853) n=1 Tax=Raoultella terrigena TaxID=577 RepID=A0A3P8J7H4_RAOTE|nr:Bacterial protein of uncharacterised function (DUF853) [Raoultella terrigena]
MSSPLLIARTLEKQLHLLPGMANRHGLITGATGTGKPSRCRSWRNPFPKSACRYLWPT